MFRVIVQLPTGGARIFSLGGGVGGLFQGVQRICQIIYLMKKKTQVRVSKH